MKLKIAASSEVLIISYTWEKLERMLHNYQDDNDDTSETINQKTNFFYSELVFFGLIFRGFLYCNVKRELLSTLFLYNYRFYVFQMYKYIDITNIIY